MLIEQGNNPIHPGEILLEEFLKPWGVTQTAFAAHIGVTVRRVNEIIKGKRGVSADTAWRLSAALGTTVQFWVNLQAGYDLARARPETLPGRLPQALAAAV